MLDQLFVGLWWWRFLLHQDRNPPSVHQTTPHFYDRQAPEHTGGCRYICYLHNMAAGHGNENWSETCWRLQSAEIIWDKCNTLTVQQRSAVPLPKSVSGSMSCSLFPPVTSTSSSWLSPGDAIAQKSFEDGETFLRHVLVTVWYRRRGFVSVHDSESHMESINFWQKCVRNFADRYFTDM